MSTPRASAPSVFEPFARDVFEKHVLGADPFAIEALWRNVYGRGYSQRPDISLMGMLSGFEMAMWDIVGKAVGKPVYALLGGRVHERLRSYTYLYPDAADAYADSPVYSDPDAAAARALDYAAMGFTAVKFDPAGPYSTFDPRQPSLERLELSEQFCKRIREAVGDALRSAVRHARPVHRLRRQAAGAAAGALRAAVVRGADAAGNAGGDGQGRRRDDRFRSRPASGLTTKYEFARVLACGAASILQMNLGRVGGLLEAKKIAGMAEAHYAQIAPHLYCGPVVGAANIQISTCSPNFLILESIERWDGFQAQLLKKPIRWEDGYVIPPDDARPRRRTRRGFRARASL